MSHKATDLALNPSLSPQPILSPPPHPQLIPGSDSGVEGGTEGRVTGARGWGRRGWWRLIVRLSLLAVKGPDSLLVL